MVAAIQPVTPGYPQLPCTLTELSEIERYVPNECLTRLGSPGKIGASVETVFSHLSTASIVHFACHAKQDTEDPLESGFLLDDGQLKVSHIMSQAMPNASLAFLSACQTATGDKNLPDEAIHLAATLLFAGFRGVVATMWWVH